MNNKIFLIFLLIFSCLLVVNTDNFKILAEVYFYVLIFILTIEVWLTRKFRLISVWIVSFLFVILSEAFSFNTPSEYEIQALKLLILSNNIIICFYYIFIGKNFNTKNINLIDEAATLKTSKFSLFFIVCVVVFYVVSELPMAIITFSVGRNFRFENDNAGLIGTLNNAISLVFPSIICYYFVYIKKKGIFIPFVLSLPIFIIIFMLGSRFPLLFSLGGFLFVFYSFKNASKVLKRLVLIFGGLLLVFSSSIQLASRSSSRVIQSNNNKNKSVTEIFAEYASPEGVISRNAMLIKHFDFNEHMYGMSTSFILYFWVPRAIWPEKPTMLGHWLVREYEEVSKFHSVSFGYIGDFYADFGYLSLFIMIFIGYYLVVLEKNKDKYMKSGGYNIIISSMFFSYIFFFVRSPITATMTFVLIFLMFKVSRYILFSRKN